MGHLISSFTRKMNRALKRVVGFLGILALVAAIGLAWFAQSFRKALLPNESLDRYQEVLADWEASGLVDHFPSSVPTTAGNVKFSSFPGFLQGGAHVQLRMELPRDEVNRIYKLATKTALQHQDGGNSMILVSERDDELPSTWPRTFAEGRSEFPADYRIFIYHAEPYGTGSEFEWNHGSSKGLVVSLKRSEVLYYAESW